MQDETESFTQVIATLGRECREWAPGATHAEVETIIEENSRPGDVIIFTDGSVVREQKSGWAYSARVDGQIISENSMACSTTLSSMMTEINAVTLALTWVSSQDYSRVVFVTDSLSTLEKVRQGNLHADWYPLINSSSIRRITWIYCPGHAGVIGNETADRLAGNAQVAPGAQILLDKNAVENMVETSLSVVRDSRPSVSHTLHCVREKGYARGQSGRESWRGDARRKNNQLLFETISVNTLRWTLARRAEQMWACPSCNDADR